MVIFYSFAESCISNMIFGFNSGQKTFRVMSIAKTNPNLQTPKQIYGLMKIKLSEIYSQMSVKITKLVGGQIGLVISFHQSFYL